MTAPKKHSCDNVQYVPEAGQSFRELEQRILREHFQDYGDHEARVVRVTLEQPEGFASYFWMQGKKGGAVRTLKSALLTNCHMMAWIPGAIPDQELIDQFSDMPEAQEVEPATEALMDIECTDMASLQEAALKISPLYSDFLVRSMGPVFQGDLYYQLRWLQGVNFYEDARDCEFRPLDSIALPQLKAFMAAARDRFKDALYAPGKAIDMKARNNLKEVQGVFDQCMSCFNEAASGGAYATELGTVVEELIQRQNITPTPKPAAP